MGFYADTGATLDVEDGVAFGNANTGVMALTGATVRLSNTTVTNNATGIHAGAGQTSCLRLEPHRRQRCR